MTRPGTRSRHHEAVLTLLRHGESEWNRFGRFTGWADVDLTRRGRLEAARAGTWLARRTRPVERCFASELRRSWTTGEIALAAMGARGLPIERSWRLNERHYGDLEGLGILEAVLRHGPLRVTRSRRRFRSRPPALDIADPRHPRLNPLWARVPSASLPSCESVADTQARLLPLWRDAVVPALAAGRHVLVVSHKHTLRALLRLLRSRDPSLARRIPLVTGTPVVLRFTAHERWLLEPAAWRD